MIKVTVFGKKECDACKAAMEKLIYFCEKWGKADQADMVLMDVETPDGLAEGAFRGVYDIPTVIIDREGEELARWVKEVPASQDFGPYFLEEPVDESTCDKGVC
jgi:thiol-disulfide isomerase/thioredoxin